MTRLLIALSFVAGLLVAPVVSASPAQAALPTTGGESTSFVIDGDSTGPDDWDAPYTAGLTPLGNKTTGMLPANFFPTFEAADFPDPSVTQVDNPAFGFFDNVPQYCEDTRGGPSEDGWLNPAGDGKLSSLRLENPAVSNNGNQILGCPSGSPQNKTNLLNAYAAFEIIEVPGTGGGSQSEYVLYGAWRRGDSETGELNFYIPVADGVDGPVDGSTYPTNTAGDRVIQFNFDNSGNFAFAIWGWDTGTGAWKVLEFIPPAATGTAIFDAAVGSGNGPARSFPRAPGANRPAPPRTIRRCRRPRAVPSIPTTRRAGPPWPGRSSRAPPLGTTAVRKLSTLSTALPDQHDPKRPLLWTSTPGRSSCLPT